MATLFEFPDKLYYKIGEVAEICGVKPHVLRYWESEFPVIRPQKSRSNQRLYRKRDVESILAIKHLLYDRKFTIEGAKKHLRDEGVEAALPPPDPEEVAARARAETRGAMADELGRVRAGLHAEFQKELLTLKRRLEDLLAHLDSGNKR